MITGKWANNEKVHELFATFKLKTIHKCFLCPYKRQLSMVRFIALQGYGHIGTWHIYNASKTLYKDRTVYLQLLLHLENKQIMPNKLETQLKHTYS